VSGEHAELVDVFVQGDRYSLVAAMTVDGYIAAHAIPGSFDAMTFYDFIAEEVVHLCSLSFVMSTDSCIAATDESMARRIINPGP
jgi:hypothetical protein